MVMGELVASTCSMVELPNKFVIFPGPGPGCFPKCLKEYIQQQGAPACIRTDSASVEISAEVLEIYRDYSIRDGQSEPYYQNQNPCEKEIQDCKRVLAHITQISHTPYAYWPLVADYIQGLRNHIAQESLNNRTPEECKNGNVPDVSKYLEFTWWEPVLFLDGDGEESLGRWACLLYTSPSPRDS